MPPLRLEKDPPSPNRISHPFSTIHDYNRPLFSKSVIVRFFFHQTLTFGKTGKSYAVLMAFFYKIQKHPRASVIPVDEYLTTFLTVLSFLRIREVCF